MALILHVKYVENLKGRSGSLAKATFRGLSHFTKAAEIMDDAVVFNEMFQWPVARPIEAEEVIDIQLYMFNKYVSNRLLGSFRMILQELVEVGSVKISDYLLDTNNIVIKVKITFELTYSAPDDSVGLWKNGCFETLYGNELSRDLSPEEHRYERSKGNYNSLQEKDRQGDAQSISSYRSKLGKELTPSLSSKSTNKSSTKRQADAQSISSSRSNLGKEPTPSLSSKSSNKSSTKGFRHPEMKTSGNVAKIARFLRRKHSKKYLNDDQSALTNNGEMYTDTSDLDAKAMEIASMLLQYTDDDRYASSPKGTPMSLAAQGKRAKAASIAEDSLTKAQDFQVCVTIVEARQLAGLNMDPVVCVRVGDHKKYTSVKQSTNCPFYNEYFVFDFHMAPIMLFDQIISLTVLHSRNFVRRGTIVGSYTFDVAAVYRMPDHQFYHKWAMLTDPGDISGGVKGYLKCDIAVLGKGNSIKAPSKSDKEDDDIESNLLLPDGVPAERQKARYVIKVYRAEGLPKMNTKIMANMRKALLGNTKDLADPYVEVHFCGHKGKTSVKKGCYEPVWNEQLVFTEMFPPLCRRIRVQLRDSNNVNDDIIGTYFLDLSCISNDGEKDFKMAFDSGDRNILWQLLRHYRIPGKYITLIQDMYKGFLPTYGPAWLNLYGSTRDYQLMGKLGHLNDGLGEGVSYRGRLLIALTTEIINSEDNEAASVEVKPVQPISEMAAGRHEEYFLFGTFLEASMIDQKVGDKAIHFEISIGNAGNVLDGYNPPNQPSSMDLSTSPPAHDGASLTTVTDSQQWESTTPAVKPVVKDMYLHLPYYEEKPCVYVREVFEEHRRRMYNTNIIDKICDKLDDGLNVVHMMMQEEQTLPEQRLRAVFDELGHGCYRFASLVKGTGGGSAVGKTRLDSERHRVLTIEMDQMCTFARAAKSAVTESNVKEMLKTGTQYLTKLRSLAIEPQHALPDVFIWLISNNKRIAYQRLPACHIIYSIVDEERGKDCGRPVTLFLRLPGKMATGSAGWTIQAKLQMFLWLGLSKHKKDFLKGLPRGYEKTKLLKQATKLASVPPPPFIRYKERQSLQLRAHLYQGRQLIGSDDTGLSDPFARIAFCNQSISTQVINETLSPTWDEMLVLDEVQMYGLIEEIANNPPTIVVEVFDQDKTGKPEFIGRVLCKPVIKLSSEPYNAPKFPPRLEWWGIYRGSEKAGELLATFELLQKPFEESELKAAYETPPSERKSGLPLPNLRNSAGTLDQPPLELPSLKKNGLVLHVPKGIRPVLSKHRIEVMFWGVRELKRVQLQSVDHPRIDIECAGCMLSSSIIANYKKNPNFGVSVKYFDVELPENDLYCPPITIRCVDCRTFGRFTLVGTHVITNIHRFKFVPPVKQATEALPQPPGSSLPQPPGSSLPQPPGSSLPQPPGSSLPQPPGSSLPQPLVTVVEGTKDAEPATAVSVTTGDVAVNLEAPPPIVTREQYITIETQVPSTTDQKIAEKKKKKKDSADDEPDMDALDWWTKYFASVAIMVKQPELSDGTLSGDRVGAERQLMGNSAKQDGHNMPQVLQTTNSRFGTVLGGVGSDDVEIKQAKKLEKDSKKRAAKQQTMKGSHIFTNLSKQFSPDDQKKGKKQSNTGVLKGFYKKLIKSGKKKENISEAIEALVVYPNELESQAEFGGFRDLLHTFELYRGKNLGNDEPNENRIVGKFKGSMKIYKYPLAPDVEDCTIGGGDPANGFFQGLPNNEPVKVLVRAYIVKANDIHPADINGKADPYLVVKLGSKTYKEKNNYVSKQLNPIFGKCFEFQATFPMESVLTVQVFDWDLIGMDDLIGETKVDLENRYYSRHRPTCGLAQRYELLGYNTWRDPQRPSQILAKLCKDLKLDGPHFQPGKVRIANRVFTAAKEIEDEHGVKKATDEHTALAALNNWAEIPKVGCRLVPEHVETRTLFHPEKPGVEQGKIEMFVDIFPVDMPAPGIPVDISARKPKSYELRCIIWNTDDVVLDDDAFFTGEKMSDIFVKGWVKGSEDIQSTDIHYRSLTGEGKFNWRFVFPFDYLVAEEKLVITRKESLFSWDETEFKLPARLNLQVWDADSFTADDFLGSLTLDLNRFPRGAKSSGKCSLDMMKTDGSVPQMSLFKQRRVKGWWPFCVKNEGSEELQLTGKVEAELQLMTAEEAEKSPAGLGRSEPDPLDKPNRPDSSFMWFMSPFKSLRYVIWHNYKWLFLKILIIAALAFLIILFFYSIPGYTVKKIFDV